MDLAHLCMGCMAPKNNLALCPECGWREGTLPESPQHLPPRTLLNHRYLIGRALGQGAFGITYLTWDINLEIKVAIKEYFPCDLVHRQAGCCSVSVHTGSLEEPYLYGLDKFFAEAKTLNLFEEHPNIVTVRDYFKVNGTAYLVMNYLEGVTLKEHLLHNKPGLPFERILGIMMPIMDALKMVHSKGILHRDVSPDNIFLTRDRKVVLIDFGAARHAIAAKKSGLSVILKLGYAPVEQYRSKGQQGPWTDVYAVAATIYRAITGRMPPESLDRMGEDPLIRPSALGMGISPRVEAALLKGMAVHAADRYQTIGELQKALQVEGAGEAHPTPPGPIEVPGNGDQPGGQTVDGGSDQPVQTPRPPEQNTRLCCEVVEGPNRGLTADLSTGEVNIGRDRGLCSLVLDDVEVSRHHARISFSPEGTTWISDLNSTNGTFVNGLQIREATLLLPGDVIKMGVSKLQCREKGTEGHDPGQPLPKNSMISIGREPSNDLIIDDILVSRRHACIYAHKGKFFIADLGSTHGTYLNDMPVTEPVELSPSSKIRVVNRIYYFNGQNLVDEDGSVAASLQFHEPDSYTREIIILLAAAGVIVFFLLIFTLLYKNGLIGAGLQTGKTIFNLLWMHRLGV